MPKFERASRAIQMRRISLVPSHTRLMRASRSMRMTESSSPLYLRWDSTVMNPTSAHLEQVVDHFQYCSLPMILAAAATLTGGSPFLLAQAPQKGHHGVERQRMEAAARQIFLR